MLVPAGSSGRAARGGPAGMLKPGRVQAQQPCSPPLLPIAGVLLLVLTPLPFSYRSRFMSSPFPCTLSPAFLRVPSNGSNSMY